MNRLSIISLATLSFLLSACASTSWSKPGATQAEYNKDSYECERDMRQSGGYGTGLAGALNAQGFAERCMIARGYTKVTVPDTATPCNSETTTCYLKPLQ